MVNAILFVFAFAMVACIWALYQQFKADQEYKRQQRNKPFKKAEYDCTENFYDY